MNYAERISAIHQCRDQHVLLRTLLASMVTPVNEESAISTLYALRGALREHAALEDDQLYPDLVQCFNTRVRAASMLFCKTMGRQLNAFEEFFRRWHSEGAITQNKQRFIDEWAVLRAALDRRMHLEDTVIYALAPDRAST